MGIHWLDGFIFVVLCLLGWFLFWKYEKRAARRWAEKRMSDTKPYNWEEEGL